MAAARRKQLKPRLSQYVSVDLTDYDVVDKEDFDHASCWTPVTNKRYIDESRLLHYFDHFQIYATTPNVLKKAVRKGVPINQRAQLWFECCGGRAFLTKHPTLFDDNLRGTDHSLVTATPIFPHRLCLESIQLTVCTKSITSVIIVLMIYIHSLAAYAGLNCNLSFPF